MCMSLLVLLILMTADDLKTTSASSVLQYPLVSKVDGGNLNDRRLECSVNPRKSSNTSLVINSSRFTSIPLGILFFYILEYLL